MKKVLLSLVSVMVLTGCAVNSYLVQKEFNKSLDAYNDSLRWRDWDNASLFTTTTNQQEFKTRVAAAKDVRMVDYRIVNMKYDAESHKATADVEIDYYMVFSYTMKTLHDKQMWEYLDEKGTKGWKVVSLLPEFK
ncbi:MAG TPA: hypothetical protein DCP92_05130 [Nitrospiraceae bacterium]|nr:hypothetical protein [Nitrospiraceae bacterium]